MTDIAMETTTYLSEDRSWLLDDLPWARTSGLINLALFTSGTHYPNGYIPSGIFVGRVTTGGRLGPYDDTATDGRQVCVGALYNQVRVSTDLTKAKSVVLIDSFAVITTAKLPTGNGLDAAGRADLPLIRFR